VPEKLPLALQVLPMALRHSARAYAAVSRRERRARPEARSEDAVPQARSTAHQQAVSPLQARGLRPVRERVQEEAELSARPEAVVRLERPSARTVLSEPRLEAAEEAEEPLSVLQEAAEAQPSVQPAVVVERDALREAAAGQDAQQAAVEALGVPQVAAAERDVQPVAAAEQDALRVVEEERDARPAAAAQGARQAARVEPLSAEPSARSDRPGPGRRPARRRMATSRHARASARVAPRRLQSSSAE
jgi:hypothetical protein